ncbi:MAG TPA: hypothetical protein VHS03_01745 [Gaiellaceae bacterium]|nr:hypothetical protein [Gaiellaceae bacterium]
MIILLVLLIATIAIAFAPGLALFAVVPAVSLVGYAIWIGLAAATGRTPARAIRKPGRRGPELLGPGGPDDPNA